MNRLAGETSFEWKLRCCKAKLNHDTDMDWQEIADMLGLDVSADHLRKVAYGLVEYDNYIHGVDAAGTRILSLSDLHVPFQLTVDLLSAYRNVDILQL